MILTYRGREIAFTTWTPADGRVFRPAFAFRPGGTKPDPARPWRPATFVVGAGYDGDRGCLVHRDVLELFLEAHRGATLVLHDAAEGLDTIRVATPGLDIYEWADADRVGDTGILHRLLTLATNGHTDADPDHQTIAACARAHLRIDWIDALWKPAGRPGDRSFGRWLNRPIDDIDLNLLGALAAEAVVVHELHAKLRRRIHHHLAGSAELAWGYVSPRWLDEQVGRWGLLTHHIQVKAAIALRAISARGLGVDLDRREKSRSALRAFVAEQAVGLARLGHLVGQPSSTKSVQSILARIERQSGILLARTASGAFATSEEALMPIIHTEPFARAYLDYQAAERLLNGPLDKMGRSTLHASFDVLKTTGRTSSPGDVGAQCFPRDPRVRSCIVARPGFTLVAADYKGIELVALAQACLAQFGLESAMAADINAGKDLHRLVASMATGKPEDEVTADERQKAKPVNFGLPGAMSRDGLKSYALAGYDVELNDVDAEALTEAWFAKFPEMKKFLCQNTDLGLAIAERFGLTLADYLEHTGSDRFHRHLKHPDGEHEPSPVLGWMFLKSIAWLDPVTRKGRAYDPVEVDYFWAMIEAHAADLPPGIRECVRERRPSRKLRQAVLSLVDSAPVFTLTGRLRAAASFPARHNTIFQGLAADGAKLALWKVWRAGYPVVNFIHDELVVEVTDGPGADHAAQEVRRMMVEGMHEVIPDVRVDVEYIVCRRWSGEPDEPVTTKKALVDAVRAKSLRPSATTD